MKTASVRDIRQNFPRVLAWIADGEQVVITKRRKVVARLVPEPAVKQGKAGASKFEDISKKAFGEKTFPDDVMESEREGYTH